MFIWSVKIISVWESKDLSYCLKTDWKIQLWLIQLSGRARPSEVQKLDLFKWTLFSCQFLNQTRPGLDVGWITSFLFAHFLQAPERSPTKGTKFYYLNPWAKHVRTIVKVLPKILLFFILWTESCKTLFVWTRSSCSISQIINSLK